LASAPPILSERNYLSLFEVYIDYNFFLKESQAIFLLFFIFFQIDNMYMVEIDYAEMVMRIDIELRKKGLKRTALEGEGVAASSLSNWVKGRVSIVSSRCENRPFFGGLHRMVAFWRIKRG
jgi:hypothetical protein